MKETLGEMPESNGGRQQGCRLVKKEFVVPFVLVTSLFFVWGFARAILDVLNKHFQMSMDITMTRSAMIQATTYIGYFLMAIPAGVFITHRGYRPGVVLGLLLFGIGSLMFIPGEWLGSFDFFLMSLFVIGCGLVVLETAANPYITELGDPSTAPSRLNLAQSFNGLGCILAPVIVGGILFSNPEASVALPYTVMGVAVLGVAVVFCFVKLPEINSREQIVASAATDAPRGGAGAALRRLVTNKGFMAGVGALFCYEIAEISINTFFHQLCHRRRVAHSDAGGHGALSVRSRPVHGGSCGRKFHYEPDSGAQGACRLLGAHSRRVARRGARLRYGVALRSVCMLCL